MLSKITTLDDLAALTGAESSLIVGAARQHPDFGYREFTIPKKRGGERKIFAPSPNLRSVQSAISQVVSRGYSPSDSTHGFVSKRGIVTNAIQHCNRNFVLNIDIRDFFDSVTEVALVGILQAPPFNAVESIAIVVASIACHLGALPQGSPLSPLLSNVACRRMDADLRLLARSAECFYSRYADDMTFSTDAAVFPAAIAQMLDGKGKAIMFSAGLQQCLSRAGFQPNFSKTRLQHKDMRQEVTGLTVNRRPRVREKSIMRVRSMLHALEKYGAEGCEAHFRAGAPSHTNKTFASSLRGRLAFIEMVHGAGDPGYRKLLARAASADARFSVVTSASLTEAEYWASQWGPYLVSLFDASTPAEVPIGFGLALPSGNVFAARTLASSGQPRLRAGVDPRPLRLVSNGRAGLVRDAVPAHREPGYAIVRIGPSPATATPITIHWTDPFARHKQALIDFPPGAPIFIGTPIIDIRGQLLGFVSSRTPTPVLQPEATELGPD